MPGDIRELGEVDAEQLHGGGETLFGGLREDDVEVGRHGEPGVLGELVLELAGGPGAGGEPRDVIVTLGYAGWAAGQLEQELLDNTWLTVPADLEIVFELPPEERLVAAMQKLGIDFTNLSDVAGHA